MGFHCTAQICVKIHEKTVSVMYYKNHYQHDVNVEHITVPDEVKKTIAGRIFFFLIVLQFY